VLQENIMHIVLIEDDYMEMDWALEELKKVFPKAQIITFKSVEDFLLKSSELPQEYILILERYLPLMQIETGEEEMDVRYEELKRQFPWVAENWTHQEAGERLIRHIRRTNKDLPIIVYTHSDKDWIAEDVRQDPKVKYCKKRVGDRNLFEAIHSFGIV
jgi:hypothetical protein